MVICFLFQLLLFLLFTLCSFELNSWCLLFIQFSVTVLLPVFSPFDSLFLSLLLLLIFLPALFLLPIFFLLPLFACSTKSSADWAHCFVSPQPLDCGAALLDSAPIFLLFIRFVFLPKMSFYSIKKHSNNKMSFHFLQQFVFFLSGKMISRK